MQHLILNDWRIHRSVRKQRTKEHRVIALSCGILQANEADQLSHHQPAQKAEHSLSQFYSGAQQLHVEERQLLPSRRNGNPQEEADISFLHER